MKKVLIILLALGLIGAGSYFGISSLQEKPTQSITKEFKFGLNPTVDETKKWFESATEIATPIVGFLSLIGGLILLYVNIIQSIKSLFTKDKKERKIVRRKRV